MLIQLLSLLTLGTLITFSTPVDGQRVFDNQLSDYNPNNIWSFEELGEKDIVYEKIYSRGNDEGWRTERSYETALMFVHLRMTHKGGSVYNISLDVFANISTSIATGITSYAVRIGSLKEDSSGFQVITPYFNKNKRRELYQNFSFSDKNFGKAVASGRAANLDARGKWIQSFQDGVSQVDTKRDGIYSGAAFIQKRDVSGFFSNVEFDGTVKHKIFWSINVKGNGGDISINDITLAMQQPKVKANDPHWLDVFLYDSMTNYYLNKKWFRLEATKKRFPEK